MKKGFTLVELLAVIVITSLVSLIVVPRLMKYVDKSREETALESARGYIKSINMSLLSTDDVSIKKLSDGIYYSKDITVELKGSKPENGIVTIKDSEVSRARLCFNNYSVDYKNKKFEKSLNDYCGETRVTLYSNTTKLNTLKEVKNYAINKAGKTNVFCNNGSIPKGNDKLTVDYPIGNTVCVISSSLKNTQNNMKLNDYSILMLNDETVNSVGLTIPKGKEVLFDLNGKKIKSVNTSDTAESDTTYSNNYYIFSVSGSLTINDDSNEGLVEAYIGSEAIVIGQEAETIINGGNYNGRRAINNNGKLTINNGNFTSKYYDVIGSYKKSTTTINNGVFDCKVNALTLYVADNSNMNIYGGIFTNTESIVLFTKTTGKVYIESVKPVYIGSYKYTDVQPDMWTPAGIKNYNSAGINVKGEIADACTEEKGINTKGICIYAKLRSVVNDNINNDSNINIDGATIVSETLRGVNTYSSTINLINTYVKGDAALSVDIGENLVNYETGLINVCHSTVRGTTHDISIQSYGRVKYRSNVSINSRKFYDTNSPTHVKLDDTIKCR